MGLKPWGYQDLSRPACATWIWVVEHERRWGRCVSGAMCIPFLPSSFFERCESVSDLLYSIFILSMYSNTIKAYHPHILFSMVCRLRLNRLLLQQDASVHALVRRCNCTDQSISVSLLAARHTEHRPALPRLMHYIVSDR